MTVGQNRWKIVKYILVFALSLALWPKLKALEGPFLGLFNKKISVFTAKQPNVLSKSLPYTGIIIDARGLNLSTGIFPRIYDTTGQILYNSRKYFLPEDAILLGAVEFVTSMDPVKGLLRAGSNPLIIKAVAAQAEKTDPMFKPHVIISKKDAQRLITVNKSNRFLEHNTVAFMVDDAVSSPLLSGPSTHTGGSFFENNAISVPDKLGIRPALWNRIKDRDGLVKSLTSLPKEMVSMYKEMTKEYKLELAEDLSKTTPILFFQVSNRVAFIQGSTMGQDTFDVMEARVDADYLANKISRAIALWRKRGIAVFRTLTPYQREAIALLIEEDVLLSNSK